MTSFPTDVPIEVEIALARILAEALAIPFPAINALGTIDRGCIFLFVSVRKVLLGAILGSSSSDSSLII